MVRRAQPVGNFRSALSRLSHFTMRGVTAHHIGTLINPKDKKGYRLPGLRRTKTPSLFD